MAIGNDSSYEVQAHNFAHSVKELARSYNISPSEILLDAGFSGQYKIVILPDHTVQFYTHVEFEQGRWRWEQTLISKVI